MFEFNGWTVLRHHTHDDNTDLQESKINALKAYLKKIDTENVTVLKSRNGLDSLLISGLHNHYQSYVIDIYHWIANHMPGSYGLLYIHDDEDKNEKFDNSNNFSVWKLTRGTLARVEDLYLSPCIPTIEDEFDCAREEHLRG